MAMAASIGATVAGKRVRVTDMKKLFILLLVISFSLLCAGCANNDTVSIISDSDVQLSDSADETDITENTDSDNSLSVLDKDNQSSDLNSQSGVDFGDLTPSTESADDKNTENCSGVEENDNESQEQQTDDNLSAGEDTESGFGKLVPLN